MKTLIISSHMDDEAISCGGLILNRENVRVTSIFGRRYNYGEGDQHEKEQLEAFCKSCSILGVEEYSTSILLEGEPQIHGYYKILKIIETALSEYQADEVVIPSEEDLNQDHRHLNDVCRIALRTANLSGVKRILVANGMQGTIPASMNYYVPMTREQLGKKIKAVGCYRREIRYSPHPRGVANMSAYHRLVGSRCGVEFAEGYTLLMEVE